MSLHCKGDTTTVVCISLLCKLAPWVPYILVSILPDYVLCFLSIKTLLCIGHFPYQPLSSIVCGLIPGLNLVNILGWSVARFVKDRFAHACRGATQGACALGVRTDRQKTVSRQSDRQLRVSLCCVIRL